MDFPAALPFVSVIARWRMRVAAVVAALLLFPTLLTSCSGPEQPPANPPLFEIVGPEGQVEGWLLGTIHALPDGIEWRTTAVDRVIEEADYLIVEVAALDDREAMAATFARLSTSADLPALSERLSPELRPQLAELLKDSDFSRDQWRKTETWAAALMLAQSQSTGDPSNGVDRAIIRDFSDRPVREFEGALTQLSIFDRLAEEDQRVMLEQVVRDSTADLRQRLRLRNAWIAGDLAVLEEATQGGILADPEVREALLTGRNRAWAERLLIDLADPPKPLIAVGAGHLVGPDSLKAMLEQRGYTVTLVTP